MSLLDPLELMIVGVIAIAFLIFRLPTVHQRAQLKFNTLLLQTVISPKTC